MQFTKRVLYRLSQRHGRTITYVKPGDAVINYQTGTQSQTTTDYTLKKVLRFSRTSSSFARLAAALGIFNRGGEIDRTITSFIIVAARMPSGLVLEKGDYILLGNQRFDVKRITELDGQEGYHLVTEALEGAEQ